MNFTVDNLPANNTKAMDRLVGGLRRGLEVKQALAGARQLKIGAAVKTMGYGTRHLDGLGYLRGAIDTHDYFERMQDDPKYWEDEQNRLNYYKEKPAALVENWVGRTKSKYIGCSMKEIDNPKFHVGVPA